MVRLLIKERYERLNHAGVQITLCALREKYWILRGRRVIRSVIEKCVSCRRHDARPLAAAPAPLPLDRVRDAAVFEVVGVDCAGPLFLKGGQKVWICLFTCAVYRAVHLELLSGLDVPTVLMALRRHIARRGRPVTMYSDNGGNFVGMNNCIERLDFKKIAALVAFEQIEWKFNPPAAPWWDGFWERLIAVLKGLLRRTLRRTCLNYEEMLTVLVDCEAVINSRPITFVSDDKNEIAPLSPAHFLQEVPEVGVVDLDRIEEYDFGRRYKYRQQIKRDLRKRFRDEYLGALARHKWKGRGNCDVKVGELVLIGKDCKKRIDWPLGRVVQIVPGTDGKVRLVRVATATGRLVRVAVQRIYPLEINCGDNVNFI